MLKNCKAAIVGIDWGTTHRRAYALNREGACVSEVMDNDGALACRGRFAEALSSAVQRLGVKPDRVVLSGMVGSALGWQEAPYLDERISLLDLPRHMHRVSGSSTKTPCAIVPGYCVRNAQGQPDVMRGEETQLLGAVALGYHTGWFALPGTHSKWVQLKEGQIVQLRTYMTGELYELLGRQGTVAAAVGSNPSMWSDTAFEDGVAAAGKGEFSNVLFSCRARIVCHDMRAEQTKSYLSGLLIGSELKDVMHAVHRAANASTFKLICSPELATHYADAARQLELHAEVLDVRGAYIAALSHIQSQWMSS